MKQADLDALIENIKKKAGPEIADQYREIIERAGKAKTFKEQLEILADARKFIATIEAKKETA